MAATGFFEQKQASPLGFGAVLALHGAVIAAVLLVKTPQWFDEPDVATRTFDVKTIPPPEPLPVPEPQQQPQAQQLSRLDVVRPVVPPRDPISTAPFEPVIPSTGPIAGSDPPAQTCCGIDSNPGIINIPPREPVRTPVRVEAQFDPRYAGSQQPPYPASEVRREREGSVRVRVTVSPDGRVAAVDRLSATSDEFWDATRRQALRSWRFRPATLDGRPVQSTKVLSIRFRLDG